MNLLPWPDSYLTARSWPAVAELVELCRTAARSGHLPSTLMVVGEPGLGREAVVLELAAALICRNGGDPACECPSCSRVRRGVHPDLQVIDVEPGSTEIRIKQSQSLVDGIDHVPFEGARRVVIIANCHTPPLNLEAASALLKALEEPPPHMIFLLLAANPLRVLPTIVSRSVQLRLRRPDPAEATELLATHHAATRDEIAALLEKRGLDAAVALGAPPEELARAAATVERCAAAALGGDALSVTSLGSLARQVPAGLQLLIAALLDLAAEADPAEAERLADVAAALLRAEQRRSVLNLDVESVVTGTLAAACRRSR